MAAEFGRRFRATIENLGSDARIAIVAPYVLIYDYTRDDDVLTLLRILHGKRDITRKVLNR
jgi:toxin ParE1/3/4